MKYIPVHPDEGIFIVDNSTGLPVCEFFGKPGKFEFLQERLKPRYTACYAGEYLTRLNKA